MPDPISAMAGGTVVSGLLGADAAKSAARTQAAAADRAMQNEREMYDIAREDLGPYRETGYTALKDIEGMRPFLTAQFGPDQFEQYLDPSMAFRQKIGEQSTARLANVGGGALSGNTLRALTDYGQGLASTEYGNAFNRFQDERTNIYNTLANIAGMGQGAVNTGVNRGQSFAGQMTGLTTGQGAAMAGGQIGAANAYGGAAQNVGNMAYLNSLMQRPAANPAVAPAGGYSMQPGPAPAVDPYAQFARGGVA
jgi:hypothetical protein